MVPSASPSVFKLQRHSSTSPGKTCSADFAQKSKKSKTALLLSLRMSLLLLSDELMVRVSQLSTTALTSSATVKFSELEIWSSSADFTSQVWTEFYLKSRLHIWRQCVTNKSKSIKNESDKVFSQ